jgi:septal ring factor EnvC (AmiA/AmiB activator)
MAHAPPDALPADLGSALVSAGPQLGVGGVVVALLVLVLRHAAADRTDYRAALVAAEQRHADELDRVRRQHDDEIAELHHRLDAQQTQLDELNRSLDEERRRRWRAEDIAARARRVT